MATELTTRRSKQKKMKVETASFQRSKSSPAPNKAKLKKKRQRKISPNAQNNDENTGKSKNKSANKQKQKTKSPKSKFENNLSPKPNYKKMRAMRRRTAPKSDLAAIRNTQNIKPSIAKKSKRKNHSKAGNKAQSNIKSLKSSSTNHKDQKKRKKYKKAQSDALNKINKSHRQRSKSQSDKNSKDASSKNIKKSSKKKQRSNKKHKKKDKKYRNRAQTVQIMDYNDVINDEQKFVQYIDNKHFFYHQQFAENVKKLSNTDVINRIRKRSEVSPPPQMVTCFSAKSRLNQKKKRPLPLAPNVYSIKVRSRPLGFYIETKHLNVIINDEDKREQVEVVDQKNKFDKVNAYISMIASEFESEWKSEGLLIGSQLLKINETEVIGMSFSKIFQILNAEPLPFEIKLAAPKHVKFGNNVLRLDMNVDSIESMTPSPSASPNEVYSDDEIPQRPMTRFKTIDETKLEKQTEKKKNKKFRFGLF